MKRLVLVGPGNANLLVLAALARTPIPGTEVHLVAQGPVQPYSAMLSGLLAGEYTTSEVAIDLVRLSRGARATLHPAGAARLDLDARTVHLGDGTALAFDLLALNVGSGPRPLPGLAHALPLKPLVHAPDSLSRLASSVRPLILGGGVAGVELALCLSARRGARVTLVSDAEHVPAGGSPSLIARCERLLARREIARVRDRVVALDPERAQLASGASVAFDVALDARGVGPSPLLEGCAARRSAQGLVLVEDTLQSVSHREVLAAGDTADFASGQRVPKAGVYAVRQAPVLEHNLRALVSGGPLRPYCAQRGHLAILDAGDGTAVADWRGVAIHARAALALKRRIDRRFLARFS